MKNKERTATQNITTHILYPVHFVVSLFNKYYCGVPYQRNSVKRAEPNYTHTTGIYYHVFYFTGWSGDEKDKVRNWTYFLFLNSY